MQTSGTPKLKRVFKRIFKILGIVLSALLALVILITGVPFLASIGSELSPLPDDASQALRRAALGERWMYGAGNIANAFTPMPKNITPVEGYESEQFYPGGAAEGDTWLLGYAQAVITPEDWESKTYYQGGNLSIPARKLSHKIDDLKVRVIALALRSASEDGQVLDSGIHVFAAVDSIGATNQQVRQIRALVDALDLESINIAATHTHSGVDSIGIYSKGGDVV